MSTITKASDIKSDDTSATSATSSSGVDQEQMDFHDRLNKAAGKVSCRKLGQLTDTHPETVRRYMNGHAPSATFLTNLCRVLGISGEWLLTGKGPMKCAQMRSHALNQADPSELMTAVANTLTNLCDRLDRLERLVQGLETRVRGGMIKSDSKSEIQDEDSKMSDHSDRIDSAPSIEGTDEDDHERTGQAIEHKPDEKQVHTRTTPKAGTSAQRIRDAIAKRSS